MAHPEPEPEPKPRPSVTPAGRPAWLAQLGRMAAWAIGALGAALLTVLLLVGIALAVAYPNLPGVSALTDYRPKLPMRVFSADGVQLGEFGEERRSFTPIGQMPQVMKDAVLAAEDTRFYQHSGVDFRGVLRAALENLRDARSQGASTITMQVARNFYLSTEKTLTRKIYEILLALKIESLLTKDQILELYMNQIFLGQRANGFAAAAEIYFGKRLQDISVAEAAMLAGLPKAPSAYNPLSNERRATQRQRYIIDRMFETGFITEAQHEQALAEPLRYRAPSDSLSHGDFVAEAARQLVYAQYGDEAYTRGLNVHVTIHAAEQAVAYRALRAGLMEFELRQVYRGPEAFVDLPADAAKLDARVAEALAEHPDNGELRAAVVLEASPRKVVAMLQNGESITVTGEGLRPVTSGLAERAAPNKRIRRGAVVRALKGAKGAWSLTQLPEVQGAMVALDPRTGALRAMVGGFDFGKNKFNRVTQAWRQPGSAFKPFIYSAALERGFTPATVINDAPLFFDAAETGSQPWEPKNYDGEFAGPLPLQTALARSKNMVSIRVLQHITPVRAQQWLGAFGFNADKHPQVLTLALGAGAVTPLQMGVAYSVFANGGHLVQPMLIQRITDHKGKLLLEVKAQDLDESMRSLPARNAFVMTSLLQEVTRSGTAARASVLLKRQDIFGKTGTTNDSMDAWFAGFHPTLTTVVWIGYDTPKKLGDRETGGTIALPVWVEYMQHALRGVPQATLTPPPGVAGEGGYWMFEEYTGGRGVTALGLEDALPPKAPSTDERSSILDLFKR
ncbi:MAG: penicillin-binding protein 1A [Rubrivivax sp.]|nr:penicillin-binding protein 1A [Rubrivivax sp.]